MSKEEDSELVLIISEQGSVVVISLNERGLSKEQFNMIEKVDSYIRTILCSFYLPLHRNLPKSTDG